MKAVPLSVANPEIAQEATTWDPSKISSLSEREMDWRCAKGHFFHEQVSKRVRNNLRCPFCSNRKLERGVNDLTVTHPEIAKDAEGWDPSYEVAETQMNRLWRCQEGHTYQRFVSARTGQGLGCLKCSTQKTKGID